MFCKRVIKLLDVADPIKPAKPQRNRQRLKTLLYKTCIRSIMTYGCQVWSKRSAKTYINKLQVIQNKSLKRVYNFPGRFS